MSTTGDVRKQSRCQLRGTLTGAVPVADHTICSGMIWRVSNGSALTVKAKKGHEFMRGAENGLNKMSTCDGFITTSILCQPMS